MANADPEKAKGEFLAKVLLGPDGKDTSERQFFDQLVAAYTSKDDVLAELLKDLPDEGNE